MAIVALWLFLCIQQSLMNTLSINEKPEDLIEKSKESHVAGNVANTASVSINKNLKLELENGENKPRAKSLVHPHPTVSSTSTESISTTVKNNTISESSDEAVPDRLPISNGIANDSDNRMPDIASAIINSEEEKVSHVKRENGDESLPPLTMESNLHTASILVQEAKLVIGLKETTDASIQVEGAEVIDESQKTVDNVQESLPIPPDADAPSSGETVEGSSKKEIDSEPSPTGDNMPSFNEWTQKRLAEQEQKGGNIPPSVSSAGKGASVPKMRQKNYASADCGAKIIGTNAEAQSSYSVLNGYHDEYMLNPCTAKIWLVIELCEPVQAKKIELANFELYSSSPREFSVYSSDRYPSRDWNLLGTYEARDEKSIQGFTLDQKPFHKFIKLEFASHYGSEHYCPLSLVRVFGTSELEVLDTDDDNDEHGQSEVHDQDSESLQEIGVESQSPNLFGTAKDAVMSIVKKAAEALSRDKNAQETPLDQLAKVNATSEDDKVFMSSAVTNVSADQCVTLIQRILIWRLAVCRLRLVKDERTSQLSSMSTGSEGVSDEDVEEMLSCGFQFLAKLLKSSSVKKILDSCSLCAGNLNLTANFCVVQPKCRYLKVLVGDVRFSALCHLHKLRYLFIGGDAPLPSIIYSNVSKNNQESLTDSTEIGQVSKAVDEKSSDSSLLTKLTSGADSISSSSQIPSVTPPLPETISVVSSSDLPNVVVNSSQSLQELIQPTKTLKVADINGMQGGVVSDDEKDSLKSSESLTTPVVMSMVSEDQVYSNESLSDSVSLVQPEVKAEDSVFEKMSESVDVVTSDKDSTLLDSKLLSTESSLSSSIPVIESSIPSDLTSTLEIIEGASSASSLSLSSSTSVPSTSTSSSSTGSNRTTPTSTANTQKESVFVRLSNRIKALELNMSLSTQYLEELSQRYRKQMEEMQKAFNKTIGALNETARRAQIQDLKQQELINSLQSQIDNLSNNINALLLERESIGVQVFEPYVFLIFIELVVAACMYALLRRHSARYFRSLGLTAAAGVGETFLEDSANLNQLKSNEMSVRRRNSFAGHPSPCNKPQRRPSEEALNISEPTIPIRVDQSSIKMGETKKKQRRHKKNREVTGNFTLSGTSCSANFSLPSNVKHKNSDVIDNGSEVKNNNRPLIPTTLPSRVNSRPRWQMSNDVQCSTEGNVASNCAKNKINPCCSASSKFVHKQSACNLLCNGFGSKTSTNGHIPNEKKNATLGEVSDDRGRNDLSVKKIFHKWFWFGQ